MRSSGLGGVAAAVVFVLSVAAGAAEMDHVLLPGDKLLTRLIQGERRSVAVAGVPGQKLSVLVKRGRSSSVEPDLRLADPEGDELALGSRLKLSKRAARIKGFAVPREGHWRLTFSALSGGGDVEVRVSGGPPTKSKFAGETFVADVPVEHAFQALPGSELSVKLAAKGKPAWTPTAVVVTPSGAVIDLPPAAKAGTIPIFLDELGQHRIRVSGGPGRYVAKLKITPPRVKGRLLSFGDVEALPVLDGFSPSTVRNDDDSVEITVAGVGFSSQHSVTLSTPERGYAAGKVSVLPTGGRATLDTTGVPPGTYRIGVSTAAGNSVYAADPIEVTNRPPGLYSVSAPEFPALGEVAMKVTGRGYDPDCELRLRRVGDGAEIPVDVLSREGHSVMNVLLHPPPYQVGVHDAIVRDPSGVSQTYPSYVDVVGYKAASADVLEFTGTAQPMGEVYAYDSTYDASRDRVLVSCVQLKELHFLLLDASTLEVLQTYSVTWPTTSSHYRPRVAWNPVDDTFAMAWIRVDSNGQRGFVRICSASDLSDELSLTNVAFTTQVTQVDVAANDDDGGWLATWEAWSAAAGSSIYAQPFASDGSTDVAERQEVSFNASGYSWTPSIVYRGDERFVVAYIGANLSETDFALRRFVLHPDGSVAQGSLQLAASNDWYGVIQPEMAVNPADGSILLAFSYYLADRARPAFALLTGPSSSAETLHTQSSDGLLATGFVDSVVWNPERQEFVLGLTDYSPDWRATLRRVTPDGDLKPLWIPVDHEGYFSVLWSGPAAGEIGFVRACDGNDANDWSNQGSPSVVLRAGRIR